jgi:hypothetical protein
VLVSNFILNKSLLNSIPKNKLQAFLSEKSLLLKQGQPQCEFESYKIDGFIEAEMRITNLYYPGLESIKRVWVNPKCPVIDVTQMDLLTGTVTLYFQQGVEAQRTVTINPSIECF